MNNLPPPLMAKPTAMTTTSCRQTTVNKCTSIKSDTRTNNKLSQNTSHENKAQGKKTRLLEEEKP